MKHTKCMLIWLLSTSLSQCVLYSSCFSLSSSPTFHFLSLCACECMRSVSVTPATPPPPPPAHSENSHNMQIKQRNWREKAAPPPSLRQVAAPNFHGSQSRPQTHEQLNDAIRVFCLFCFSKTKWDTAQFKWTQWFLIVFDVDFFHTIKMEE